MPKDKETQSDMAQAFRQAHGVPTEQIERERNVASFKEFYEKIQNHLNAGGVVQITTYLRSTLYQKKHVGFFSHDAKGVYVQSGKQRNQIVASTGPLVSIRFGRYE